VGIGSARSFDVAFAPPQQQFEVACAGIRVDRLLALFRGLRARQTQHRFARLEILAIGQAERFAAQTQLGWKTARQRQPLGAIPVFERDRWEAVARNQDVRVNGALELPVIGDEKVRGRICEWFRYRVSPMLIRL
jgi:hypothetical protein